MEEDDEYQELDCCLCTESYSDHRIPRNLNCGHSFCTSCLEQLMKDDNRCPECRAYFSKTKISDLPVNYPLLRISRLINYAKTDPNVFPKVSFPLTYPSSELRQNAGNCSTHGETLFFMCISCSVWVCRVCVDVQHLDHPRGNCLIMSVEDAIEKMKCLHVRNLQTCLEEVNLVKKKLETDIGNLVVAARYLRFQKSSCDSECTADILSIENHCSICKDCAVAVNSIQDVMTKARDKFSASNIPQEIEESMKLSNESQDSLEDLLETEKRHKLPDISLEKLLRGKGLKDLLKEGNPVFAERIRDSNSWTKIILKNNRLHLYSLVDGSPPEDGISLPYDSVCMLVPKESPMVFLEIGWKSEVRGVVYVRMYGDTARGRSSVLLCSGDRGMSYRNTRFFRVKRDDGIPHVLKGGQLENRSDRANFVDDITNSPNYVHELKAGLFFGSEVVRSYNLSIFSVCLTDGHPGLRITTGYGFVEEGLDVLKEVASLDDCSDASILNCGLVIPI